MTSVPTAVAAHTAVLNELDRIIPVLARLHARALSAAGRAEAVKKKLDPDDTKAISRVAGRTKVHVGDDDLPDRARHATLTLPTRREVGPDVREDTLQVMALVKHRVLDTKNDRAAYETLADQTWNLLLHTSELHDTHHLLAALDEGSFDLAGARDAARVVISRTPDPDKGTGRTVTEVALFLNEAGRSLCRSVLVLAERNSWSPAPWTALREDDDVSAADMLAAALHELDVR